MTQECDRCKPGEERFHWAMTVFNVYAAITLVNKTARPTRVINYDPENDLVYIDSNHVNHVDPSIPGIVAVLTFKATKGRKAETFPVVIDGHHRAARCVRDGDPFRCYVLSEEESYALIDRERSMGAHMFKKPKAAAFGSGLGHL